MIQGVIFDLGHTLIHLTEDHDTVARAGAEAMAEWYFKKKRIKLDQAGLVETFLRERAAAWQAGEQSHQETPIMVTLEKSLDAIEAPSTAKNKTLMEMAIKIYFEPEQSAWRAYPDAIDSLRALKRQGLRL
ncbi:MAG: hypothetical protein R3264_21120, partial [Anaerolineae bacterium]|nr:hypothetical protein [Anaerolineae bacterium]